jgi:hypothetical protein
LLAHHDWKYREEVLQRAREHGTQVHSLNESEIQNPEMQNKLRSLIRKTD